MTDLKPCPFCGGSDLEAMSVSGEFHVFCYDCEASSRSFDGSDDANLPNQDRARNDAVAAWNTRAIDIDALIAAGVREGLRMGADTAEHRWREWGNLAPHEKVECDVTACEDVARSILSTSPEAISAAVARVKGGE